MAASGKGADPGAARRAASAEVLAPVLAKGRRTEAESAQLEDYLRRQTELLALDLQGYQDLQDLELAHLRVRRWRDRLEVAVMASVAVLAVALVVALGAMVWQAAGSRDVVVDTFSVPPALTATGMNGEVVAKRLLDRIDAMQLTSNSTLEKAAAYRRAGEDPIRIAIPAAGISVGDLDRYLHRWLGHETHITGEVISTPAGLQAIARYGDGPAVAATGPDPDALLEKVAEGVFAQARPLRYADYLINTGRYAEAEAALSRLAANGTAHARALALAGWANVRVSQGDVAGAWEKARAAVDLDPENAVAQAWYAAVAYMSGRWESALRGATAAVRESERGGRGPGSTPLSDTQTHYFRETAQEMSGDFAGAILTWRQILASADINSLSADQSIGQRAAAYARAHDTATARPIADQMSLAGSDGRSTWSGAIPRVAVSVEAKDWSGALAAGDPAIAAAAGQPSATAFVQSFLRPRLAIAHAESGDFAGGESLIAPTPLTCDPCLIARGRIAALKGDAAASDRWFATAAANSPSTPFANTAWGEALLARGQADAAITKLAKAHSAGPRFADALEIWGEALARKGASEDALAKFAQAATYAPRWGRLHLKWGEALARAGKRDEARAKFKAAAGMEMSSAERAELRGQAP